MAAALALSALLTGCGSDSDDAASPQETTATSASSSSVSPSSSLKVAEGCQPIGEVVTSKPQESAAPIPSGETSKTLNVTIATNCGDIEATLDGTKAPKAVANFVHLAGNGFYEKTLCHRLVPQGIFVLQCGDPTGTGTGGPGYSFGPVENAPTTHVYGPGTLAMARRGQDGNSNGSQFFLVYETSTIPADSAGGYTVFGNVTKGIDIVRKIAQGGLAANGVAPANSISLEKVTVK